MAVRFKSCGNSSDLVAELNRMQADIAALRAAVVATHAKLDADAGVTDTDYASANDPAALTQTGFSTS